MFDDSHCVLGILVTNRKNLNIHHDHSPVLSTKLLQYYYYRINYYLYSEYRKTNDE